MKKIVYLFLVLLLSQNVIAQIKTWNGSVSTDWNNASNWTPSGGASAGVPTASDEAIIPNVTNKPLITSGSAVARRISMNVSSTLGISAGVTLTVINPAGIAFTISSATLTNAGTIIVTNNNPSFVSGESALILNTGAIVNNTGSITINGNLNEGLRLAQANFNNQGGGSVVANGFNCIRFANANAVLTNSYNATMTGTTSSTVALNINAGNIGNYGNMDFTGNCEMYVSSSQISNLYSTANTQCGQFKITGDMFIQNSSTVSNSGYFYVSGQINNNGSLSSSGVLKYNTAVGTAISNSSGSVRVNNSPTPIFSYTGTFNGTINGIFIDAAATVSAGTFTAPNTFTPSGLPAGSQTLYAKITPSGGLCNYIVPFIYIVFPTVTTQPSNITICAPTATSFSVVATNTTNYQWQLSTDGGTTYNNIVASSIYSGETTSTLNISNTTGLTTYRYRCVVSNSGGSVNSNGGILTVITPASTPTGTLTWTGTISTDWDFACNWSPASVPTAGNDVIIPNTTNKPTITATTTALAKTVEVQASAILTIAATGSLTVNGSRTVSSVVGAFHNAGTVQNNGLINIGSTTSSGASCIANRGTFNNNSGGEINADNSTSDRINNNNSGTFNNSGKLNLGLSIAVLGRGIFNDNIFNNNSGGEIKIENVASSSSGIFSRNGTFTNSGKITIGATTNSPGILNDDLFNNNASGEIFLGSFYSRSGTFNNFGLLSIEYTGGQLLNRAIFNNKPCGKAIVKIGSLSNDSFSSNFTNEGLTQASNSLNNSSSAIFTNNGTLIYGSVSGTITSATNPSLIVNNNAASSAIFTYGGAYNGTINGIFTDAAATLSAGTFTAPNTFVPTVSGGSQTLYAKITPSGGGCFYIVPFVFVSANPVITSQPVGITTCSATSFSISATNAVSYQWQVSSDGGMTFTNIVASSIYTNVTTTTLNISSPTGLDGNQYRCVATNAAGSANSNSATLNPLTLVLVSPTDDINSNVGTKRASQIIMATNKLTGAANTIYRAGNAVQLNAGFEAQSGTVFTTQIGGCN
jgi:trimeric autotransporter adhesin